MSRILDKICESVKARLEVQKAELPLTALESLRDEMRKPLDFPAAFRGGGVNVIAEIKFARHTQDGQVWLGDKEAKVDGY